MMCAQVLIVDDDVVLLEALSEALALRMDGVEVAVCDSALVALERISSTDYDAIVADIKMPGMDGLELLTRIRELRPDTPTILITGHGEHDLAVRALRGGAHDYVQKPIDRDYFVSSLNRAIECRQLGRKLTQQRSQLEQHARELDECVRERTNELREFFHREQTARTELDEANRKLEEARRQREQLISMIAHDFGQPLTVVMGYAELLGDANLPEDVRRRASASIVSETLRMSRLVGDLGDTARMAIRQFQVQLEPNDLREIIEEQVEIARIRSHYHTIRLELPAQAVSVSCDRDRMAQVLSNLLVNALKHTREGEIRVRVWIECEQIWFSVSDEGPGIPDEYRESIFEPYFRHVADEPADEPTGAGLGLHIAKGIIDAHGGRISLATQRGHGTTFTVCLPLAPQLAPVNNR